MTHPKPHDQKHDHKHDQKDTGPLQVAVITVSDTRTVEDDRSGATAAELLRGAGHEVISHVIVRDERVAIVAAIRAALGLGASVVVTNGGTGIAARDVTYEAVSGLLEKTLDGFGEAFRRLSWDEIGPRAMLSRAVAGTLQGSLVVALPGSTKGVQLGVSQLVIPIARHAVGLLRG
jgi:molybdenum cofactor biosynthesis protein B